MAKIIIEVSDDIIRQRANKENFNPNNGENPMKMLYDLIAFGVIEKKINEGQTEFHVSRDNLKDDGSLGEIGRAHV